MSVENKQIANLESLPVIRLLWRYFVPAFTGVIVNSLYNIVDRIFIGQGVGSLALAGLSAVYPIMLIMMGFGMLIGIGAGVRISINFGKKDFNRAEKVLGNAFVLMIIMAILITILGFIIKEPMLRAFGASAETSKYAHDYLDIILFGSIFNIVGFSLNNIIRSEGSAKVAMQSMFISAGVNVVLDPIFIFGFGWGVKGAAWATIISQFLLCVWVIYHFRGGRSIIKLKLKNFKLQKDIVFYILTIGFAPFAMQVSASMVQAVFNSQLISHGGDIAVGAMGIINSVSMLLVMSVIAINMAAQPIWGFSYGAKLYERLRQTLKIALIAATGISVFGFLIVQIFPCTIIKLFNAYDPELIAVGRQGIVIFFSLFPLVGFQIIVGNYFQSIGRAAKATVLSLLRQVIVLIPLLFILPHWYGLVGVWLATPVSDIISASINAVVLSKEWKRIKFL
ncbi:MAG: MATE family efflux transporter [Bacteroidales bacterium]|jgi:putative MATE family efflux protein|nr:MATE family efflux transporter [Bacteroidales bacterium]